MTAADAQAGSAMASLWLKVNHEQQAAASPPAAGQPCPQCGAALAPPLKSSGRQVCRCGWSDQPRANPSARPRSEAVQTEVDLLHLLEKAASESLENMKPRKKNS